jgi:hypothetical protein
MVVIFLDFDGVLHPYAPWPFAEEAKRSHFQHLPCLESVLRDHSEVRIVIASDWRLHNSIDELRTHFSPDIQPRVIGTTALDRPSGVMLGQRHLLAERFMSDNNLLCVPWIAIDDTKESYLPDSPLLLCGNCFNESSEALLREMLNRIWVYRLAREGDSIKPQLLVQAGGFLRPLEVSELLGVTAGEVESCEAQRLLLAPLYRGERVYPRCQFSGNAIDPCVSAFMRALAEYPWTGLKFLLVPQEALGGMTPLSALRSGDADLRDVVIRLLRIISSDGFD